MDEILLLPFATFSFQRPQLGHVQPQYPSEGNRYQCSQGHRCGFADHLCHGPRQERTQRKHAEEDQGVDAHHPPP